MPRTEAFFGREDLRLCSINLHSPASASDMIRLLNSPPAPSLGWPFRRHLRLSNVKVIFFFKNKSFIMILPLWLAAVGHHTTSHSCRAGQFAYCASAWSTVFLGDHIDGNDHTERIITVKHRVPHHTFVPQFSPPVSEITLTCRTFLFSRTSARPVLTASCIV